MKSLVKISMAVLMAAGALASGKADALYLGNDYPMVCSFERRLLDTVPDQYPDEDHLLKLVFGWVYVCRPATVDGPKNP